MKKFLLSAVTTIVIAIAIFMIVSIVMCRVHDVTIMEEWSTWAKGIYDTLAKATETANEASETGTQVIYVTSIFAR